MTIFDSLILIYFQIFIENSIERDKYELQKPLDFKILA
jgi:hypothetical protein